MSKFNKCNSFFLATLVILKLSGVGETGLFAQSNQSTIAKELNSSINTITTAVPFLMIAPDARSGGMGDAGVATDPDANSNHWNASKLAFADDKMGFSVSYVPWMRTLVPDIDLAYLSGYYKPSKDEAFSGSLRYFSLGDITFTDVNGNNIGQFRPNEFALDGGYSRKLSENFSVGMVGRFIYSDLTNGVSVLGAETHAGKAFAVDLSAYYRKSKIKIGEKKGNFAFGVNISNIGNKIAYSTSAETDFLPINLRLGPALKIDLDDYNTICFTFEFNKLLVPTPPIYKDSGGAPIINPINGQYEILAGRSSNVGVPAGIFGSFTDAPGGFKEELRDIDIASGIEYWYDKQFALRGGFFYENPLDGNRIFFTMGVGLKYNVFGLDFCYLIPTDQRNPLENTLQFTLFFNFSALKNKGDETKTD
jgi:hypothetical protein